MQNNKRKHHTLHCPICYERTGGRRLFSHAASHCRYKRTRIACNCCGGPHKITECAFFNAPCAPAPCAPAPRGAVFMPLFQPVVFVPQTCATTPRAPPAPDRGAARSTSENREQDDGGEEDGIDEIFREIFDFKAI